MAAPAVSVGSPQSTDHPGAGIDEFALNVVLLTLLRGIIDIGEGRRERGDAFDLTDLWMQREAAEEWLEGEMAGPMDKAKLLGRYAKAVQTVSRSGLDRLDADETVDRLVGASGREGSAESGLEHCLRDPIMRRYGSAAACRLTCRCAPRILADASVAEYSYIFPASGGPTRICHSRQLCGNAQLGADLCQVWDFGRRRMRRWEGQVLCEGPSWTDKDVARSDQPCRYGLSGRCVTGAEMYPSKPPANPADTQMILHDMPRGPLARLVLIQTSCDPPACIYNLMQTLPKCFPSAR
jgi:hypothetical protein